MLQGLATPGNGVDHVSKNANHLSQTIARSDSPQFVAAQRGDVTNVKKCTKMYISAPKTQNHNEATSSNLKFVRSSSHTSDGLRSISVMAKSSLKKSSSCQNIKTVDRAKNQRPLLANNFQDPGINNKRTRASTTSITSASIIPEFSSSEPQCSFDSQKSESNAHRIFVNSDLLSRVEREKKQYEARISELTQVAETRKMEIEKLSFAVRHSKEEIAVTRSLLEEVKTENLQLRNQMAVVNAGQPATVESHQTTKPLVTTPPKILHNPISPPESLGTTTRLTPGGATTVTTGGVSTSSRSSEWNDHIAGFETCLTDEYLSYGVKHVSDNECGVNNKKQISVATLQGRLQQMEEANYTTNEELQATLQELWDFQRSVDEAHEEVRSLAFERAILLEALSTQTSKLEHCRFQIEQLKQLLLTNQKAQNTEAREHHLCELYASVEQEKQVLLGQNNDLAESSDSLARECQVLTEKASALQDNYDALENEHSSLKKLYQALLDQSNALQDKTYSDSIVTGPRRDTERLTNHEVNHLGVQTDIIVVQDHINFVAECHCATQKELDNLKQKFHYLEEKFHLSQCEYERETTEWRLYERDLLKAVQVADSLKVEAEADSHRLMSENATLKERVEKLSTECEQLNTELNCLRERLVKLSPATLQYAVPTPSSNTSEEKKLSPPLSSSVTITKPDNAPLAAGKTSKPYSEHNAKPVTQTTTSHLNPIQFTEPEYNANRTSLLHSYSTHRNSNCGHLHTPYTTGVHNSPGAPGRSSILTTGPTVRSLIQSIENQVKAVQHQKRGIATKSTRASNVTNSQPARLYSAVNNNSINKSSPISTNNCLNFNSAINLPTTTATTTSTSGGIIGFVNANATNKSELIDPIIDPNSVARKLSNNQTDDSSSLNIIQSSAPGGPISLPLPDTNTRGKFMIDPGLTHKSSHSSPNAKQSKIIGVNEKTPRRNNTISVPSPTFNSTTTPPPVVQNPATDTTHLSQQSDVEITNHPARPDLTVRPFRRFTTPAFTETKLHADSAQQLEDEIRPSHANPVDTTDSDSANNTGSFHGLYQVRQDPLQELARLTGAGSKRNALLKWCQSRVLNYPGVEVTNFSRSWNNGLAFCALMHTYVPSKIPWNELVTSTGLPIDKRRCFEIAFKTAESEGIPTTLPLQYILTTERPDWNIVMNYVTSIYNHYEVESARSVDQ